MKKTLFLFLCLISVSIYADARMTALMMGGGVASVADGPNTWYDATTSTTTGDYSTSSYQFNGSVTIAQAGSATKLRAYCAVYNGAETWAIGLYNSSKALLGQCNLTINGTGLKECTLGTPVEVSSGSYWVGFVCSSGCGNNRVTTAGDSNGNQDSSSVSGVLNDPFTGWANYDVYTSVYVD